MIEEVKVTVCLCSFKQATKKETCIYYDDVNISCGDYVPFFNTFCLLSPKNGSHVVQWLGFVVFTHATRVRIPAWEHAHVLFLCSTCLSCLRHALLFCVGISSSHLLTYFNSLASWTQEERWLGGFAAFRVRLCGRQSLVLYKASILTIRATLSWTRMITCLE